MLKLRYKILIFFFFLLIIIANLCCGEEYWQQFVNYTINAKLDICKYLIIGNEILLYKNNSPDTLSELYFHLYPNAFQKNSIMFKEAKAASVELINCFEEEGWIEINSLIVTKTKPNTKKINSNTLIHDTIMKIELFPPLLPHEQLQISLNFITKIRRFNHLGGKGGYRKNVLEVSQWYPKICVYDNNGWNAIKYHWLGEFYGEFGTFDVSLTVPDSFIIAATGELVSGDPGWQFVQVDSNCNQPRKQNFFCSSSNQSDSQSSTRTVTFHAENVHDFVWVASSDYLYQTDIWQNTAIHVLFRNSSQKQWCNEALDEVKKALKWLNDLIGEYPYPQITVCEALTPGGMEYPMLTILGYLDSTLIVHEIGHMYFYAAVANNEQDEGWLDEGLITYISQLFDERYEAQPNRKHTPSINIPQLRKQFEPCYLKDVQLNSLYFYFYSGFEKPLNTKCYQLNNKYLYSYHVYLKPTKFFTMLDYLIGHETFVKILKTYYQQFKFKHVNAWKFQTICEQVSGMDLDWFFDQWISNTTCIDYALTDLFFRKQENGFWKTDITIKRIGHGIMPVETEIVTETGEKIRKRCDGRKQQTILTFYTPSKVKTVQLDPDDVILDQNRLNNSRLRIKPFFYPEFPNMYYLPRNAYSLFLWPRMWYNEVDGFKIGINVLGSYLNRYYVTRNYFWYGFKSRQLDFNLGYSIPWESIHKNLWRHIYILKIEGRMEINLNLNYNIFKQFASRQIYSFRLGFSHQHVNNTRYTYRQLKTDDKLIKIQEWDLGDINKFYVSYHTNCYDWLPNSNLEFDAKISNKAWGSDFNYTSLSLSYQFQLGDVRQNWRLKIRNFLGYSYQKNNRIPIQDKFWIAEGNPNQRFKYFYLRSPGSMPTWINYHFPGDGNLRGYLNKLIAGNSPLVANRLISTNIEFIHRNLHHILPKTLKKQIQGIDFAIFFDAGRVWVEDLNKKYLVDAGIGLRCYKKIIGKQRLLRIDFPLWVRHPQIDKYAPPESSWKFRWIVSFQ